MALILAIIGIGAVIVFATGIIFIGAWMGQRAAEHEANLVFPQ